jgi:GT2 family glycosyltransferase
VPSKRRGRRSKSHGRRAVCRAPTPSGTSPSRTIFQSSQGEDREANSSIPVRVVTLPQRLSETQERLPATSLVICTRNRPRLLRDCIASVLRGSATPSELIVVDDSDSVDRAASSLATSRACEIRYVWRRSLGLSSAVNHAMKLVRHDLCAFLQDDVEADVEWLATLVRELVEGGGRTIVVGQVREGEPEVEGGFSANSMEQHERLVFREPGDRDVLFAQNMALYRATFDEVGPFDERLGPGTPYPASEDSDWALQALRLGYAIVYQPAAIVSHRAWRPAQDYVRFRWGYGVGRGGFYAKHALRGDRHIRRRLRRDIGSHLMSFPQLLLRSPREAAGNVALACGIVFGASRWAVVEKTGFRKA